MTGFIAVTAVIGLVVGTSESTLSTDSHSSDRRLRSSEFIVVATHALFSTSGHPGEEFTERATGAELAKRQVRIPMFNLSLLTSRVKLF